MDQNDDWPSKKLLESLYNDAMTEHFKLVRQIKMRGNDAAQFLEDRISADSWTVISNDAAFPACCEIPLKDAFELWRIVMRTHAMTDSGESSLTPMEAMKLEAAFNSWTQGDLSLPDYYKSFRHWQLRREMAKLPSHSEATLVELFFSKLNNVAYEEVLRLRLNSQRQRIHEGSQKPTETLAGAYQYVSNYVPAPVQRHIPLKSSSSIFVSSDAHLSTGASDVTNSAERLLVALQNFTGGTVGVPTIKSSGKISPNPNVGRVEPLMVRGREWTKPCLVPGCGQRHPYWLHQQITGTPLPADLQAKQAQYTAKQASRQSSGAQVQSSSVLVAPAADVNDDDEDDNYSVERFFVAALWDTTTDPQHDNGSPFDSEHLLFDGQAGRSVVMNPAMLTDIRPLSTPRVLGGISKSDGGITAYHSGKLLDLGRVAYCPEATANILAHADCRRWNLSVHLDDKNDTYTVSAPSGPVKFRLLPSSPEAHYACRIRLAPAVANDSVLVATVADNLSAYSTAEVTRATAARKLQVNLGMPSSERFIAGLNGMKNADITPADIRRADDIGGKHPVAKIRGGTHQRVPPSANVEHLPRGPPQPASMQIDIMFIQGLAFLVCVLLPVDLIMACWLKHRTVQELGQALDHAVAESAAHDFQVNLITCDGEKSAAAYADELKREGICCSWRQVPSCRTCDTDSQGILSWYVQRRGAYEALQASTCYVRAFHR
jgi:hypothetical protein